MRKMAWLDNLPPVPEESLAAYLRSLMRERGMSQTELADLTGIPQPRINDYVWARRKTARKGTLEQFDKAFGLPRGTFYLHTYGEGAMGAAPAPGSVVIETDNELLVEVIDLVSMLEAEPQNLERVKRMIQTVLGPRATSGTTIA